MGHIGLLDSDQRWWRLTKGLWRRLNKLYTVFVLPTTAITSTPVDFYQAQTTVNLSNPCRRLPQTPPVNCWREWSALNCELWSTVIHDYKQPSSLHRSPPVSLMSDSRRNHSCELEMASHLRMIRRMGVWWEWKWECFYFLWPQARGLTKSLWSSHLMNH